MGYVVLAVVLGLIPGVIAQRKDRSFVAWWIFGAALFIVALPAALMVSRGEPDPNTHKRCPDCREWIDRFAARCSKCGAEQAARR